MPHPVPPDRPPPHPPTLDYCGPLPIESRHESSRAKAPLSGFAVAAPILAAIGCPLILGAFLQPMIPTPPREVSPLRHWSFPFALGLITLFAVGVLVHLRRCKGTRRG